ncbi:hypothetical protein H632_c1619p0, partial [Helicosporidium sp. ATCC 50920]
AAHMRRQVAEARAARAREEAEARAQSEAQLRRAQQQLEEERRAEVERKAREAQELAGVMRENGRALQAKKDLRAREIEEEARLAGVLAEKAAREEAEAARAAEALKKKDLDLARMWARHQRGLDIRAAEEELRIKKLVEEREAAEKRAIEAEEVLRVRRAESLARELGAQLEERRERGLERAAAAEKEAILAREADVLAKRMREKETRELGEKKLAQRAALATQVDRRRRGEEAEAEKRLLDAEAERERRRRDLEVLEELRLQQLEELRDVPENAMLASDASSGRPARGALELRSDPPPLAAHVVRELRQRTETYVRAWETRCASARALAGGRVTQASQLHAEEVDLDAAAHRLTQACQRCLDASACERSPLDPETLEALVLVLRADSMHQGAAPACAAWNVLARCLRRAPPAARDGAGDEEEEEDRAVFGKKERSKATSKRARKLGPEDAVGHASCSSASPRPLGLRTTEAGYWLPLQYQRNCLTSRLLLRKDPSTGARGSEARGPAASRLRTALALLTHLFAVSLGVRSTREGEERGGSALLAEYVISTLCADLLPRLELFNERFLKQGARASVPASSALSLLYNSLLWRLYYDQLADNGDRAALLKVLVATMGEDDEEEASAASQTLGQ